MTWLVIPGSLLRGVTDPQTVQRWISIFTVEKEDLPFLTRLTPKGYPSEPQIRTSPKTRSFSLGQVIEQLKGWRREKVVKRKNRFIKNFGLSNNVRYNNNMSICLSQSVTEGPILRHRVS